jgi:hypothetical protein
LSKGLQPNERDVVGLVDDTAIGLLVREEEAISERARGNEGVDVRGSPIGLPSVRA